MPEDSIIALENDLRDPYKVALEVQTLLKEKGERLQGALNLLSEARQLVLRYTYFDEITPPEIAEKMGKTLGAVYSLQFHALHDYGRF